MTRSARHARRSRIFILIVSIFLLIMAAAYLAVGVYYKDRFFPGSYINGEDCSGMTVDEVEKRIADSVTDYQITITERGGAEEVIDGSAIDFSYVSTGAVQELQEAQNSFNWMYAFFHPEDHSMVVETFLRRELSENGNGQSWNASRKRISPIPRMPISKRTAQVTSWFRRSKETV